MPCTSSRSRAHRAPRPVDDMSRRPCLELKPQDEQVMSFKRKSPGCSAGEDPTVEDGWNEDTGEAHTPWRKEPGSSSKWELDQSLVYGNSQAPGPANKPDLDAISEAAAEAVSGLLDDMAVTESDFEPEQSAEEIDANVLNKAAEFSGPRNRDAQFPRLVPEAGGTRAR